MERPSPFDRNQVVVWADEFGTICTARPIAWDWRALLDALTGQGLTVIGSWREQDFPTWGVRSIEKFKARQGVKR